MYFIYMNLIQNFILDFYLSVKLKQNHKIVNLVIENYTFIKSNIVHYNYYLNVSVQRNSDHFVYNELHENKVFLLPLKHF